MKEPTLPDGRPKITEEMNPNTSVPGWPFRNPFSRDPNDEEKVARPTWRDRSLPKRPRRTFIEWFNYRSDEILSLGIMGFFGGCATIVLLIGLLIVAGLIKWIF